MLKFVLFMVVLLAGCTIRATVLFRNYSNQNVRLQATLGDRTHFDTLPSIVNFYDTSSAKRKLYGEYRASSLVTWVDTTTFYIDVPASTVVNLADVSRGLVLGSRRPDVLLVVVTDEKVDTLTTGDYPSLAKKFQSTGYGLFGTLNYHYDIH